MTLTTSQEAALRIAAERTTLGLVTYTSNLNDEATGCVAAGSASKLVDLGLAEWQGESLLSFSRIMLTDAGMVEAAKL